MSKRTRNRPQRHLSAQAVLLGMALVLSACGERAAYSETVVAAPSEAVSPAGDDVHASGFTLSDTAVHELVADGSGRAYPVWIALPSSYAEDPDRLYPVVFVTDAPYSFPLVRSIRNFVGQRGRNIEDFILVALAPEAGLPQLESRSRDYTPSDPRLDPANAGREFAASSYGEAAAYRDFVRTQVFPLLQERYRADMQRTVFAGHSYGGLFGSFVLLTEPEMFGRYILSSPSLWFDSYRIREYEEAFAVREDRPEVGVRLYIGSFETVKPGPRYYRNTDMVGDTQAFGRRLRALDMDVDSEVIADEDHFTAYPAAITRGLLWALPGHGPYTSG